MPSDASRELPESTNFPTPEEIKADPVGWARILIARAGEDYERIVRALRELSETAEVALNINPLELSEVTDPAAPLLHKAKVYLRDDGAGKSQLVVRFPTGDTQVLATEPATDPLEGPPGGGGGVPPGPPPPGSTNYLTDTGIHPPPTTGTYAYYNTYGTFGPSQGGFPPVGTSYTDPVFGGVIRRLTNELGQHSSSEQYSKNCFFNADGTRVHHRDDDEVHTIIDTTTGAVVRTPVTFNTDSSFDPVDPDVWYNFDKSGGSPVLTKYLISTGVGTVLKTFPSNIGQNGGSVDWIDRTGRYFVLRLGGLNGVLRVWDKTLDILYAGSIPSNRGGGGGWFGISPDGNYVITSTPAGATADSESWAINHVTKTLSTTPVLFWTLCGGHLDIMTASDGKTYAVSFDCWDAPGGIYRIDVTLPQARANITQQRSQNRLLFPTSITSDDGHFSCVMKGALVDYAYVSVESGDPFGGDVSNWRAYKQEIVMANVLTGVVRRYAHHRSRSPGSNYYWGPKVQCSPDGKVVLWQSNYGENVVGYADLYAMSVPS